MRFKFTYEAVSAPTAPTVPTANETDIFMERARQYAETYFGGQKALRKKRSNEIHAELGRKLKDSEDTVLTFRTFEADYLAIGAASLDAVLSTLQSGITALHSMDAKTWGPPPVKVTFDKTERGKAVIKVAFKTSQPKTIGTLFHGTERYVLAELALQPPTTLNPVYYRRGLLAQHYISYRHGNETLFVRRYVIRGLNQSDAANIEAGQSLVAPYSKVKSVDNEIKSNDYTGKFPNSKIGQDLTIEEQILSHTRGWAKRFVSTTVTQRPIYSTRGTEFRSVFGAVIVDLALVPGDNIYDIHAPGALTRFSVSGDQLHKVAHQGDPAQRSHHDEQLLAARDVVRTRELLIRRSVPFGSLKLKDCGACVLGVRVADAEGAKDASQLVFAAQEKLWGNTHQYVGTDCPEYRVDAHWVKYYRFSNAAAALLAKTAVPTPLHDKTILLHAYDFPDVPPIGFQR